MAVMFARLEGTPVPSTLRWGPWRGNWWWRPAITEGAVAGEEIVLKDG